MAILHHSRTDHVCYDIPQWGTGINISDIGNGSYHQWRIRRHIGGTIKEEIDRTVSERPKITANIGSSPRSYRAIRWHFGVGASRNRDDK